MKSLYFLVLVALLSISSCHIIEITKKLPCDPPSNCEYDLDLVDTTTIPGRPFMRGQLVLSNTKRGGSLIENKGISIDEKYVEDITRNIYLKEEFKTEKPKNPNPKITVRRCICDEYIFIIEMGDIIGSENNVAEAGNRPKRPNSEGWSFSLNYMVPSSIDEEGVPRFMDPNKYSITDGNTSDNEPIVAILDTGIDFSPFDNNGLYAKGSGENDICSIEDDYNGYNFIDSIPNQNVVDDNGHGTLVSLAYKYGLDKMDSSHWSSQRLLPVKVLDSCGIGTIYSTVCGLAYARRKKAAVVNCSWGLDFNNFQMQRAIDEFDQNVNIVCSAGNSGKTLSKSFDGNHFPSGYAHLYMRVEDNDQSTGFTSVEENVFEVAALNDKFDNSCPSSSIGALANYSNRRSTSISTRLYAERGGNAELLLNNPLDCYIQGTSFAAPLFAAGVIDRGISNNSFFSPSKVIIENNCSTNSARNISSYFTDNCY